MSAPASAQTWSDHYSVRVVYGDLNLNSDTGADTFLNRLDDAGASTCGQRMGRTSLREFRATRGCAVAFTQRGVIELNHQHVNARYIARGGRLPVINVASM
jgi:UrcA family protein